MIPSLPLRVLTRRPRGSTAAASTQTFGVNSAFNAEVFVAAPHAVAMEFDLFGERRSSHWVKGGDVSKRELLVG
jgi:hypothetical protein